MKKVGFIGAYDKTDMILNIAKITTKEKTTSPVIAQCTLSMIFASFQDLVTTLATLLDI